MMVMVTSLRVQRISIVAFAYLLPMCFGRHMEWLLVLVYTSFSVCQVLSFRTLVLLCSTSLFTSTVYHATVVRASSWGARKLKIWLPRAVSCRLLCMYVATQVTPFSMAAT